MPVTTIPLIGPQTRRGYGINVSTSKDQYFQGALTIKATDAATGTASYFLQKRPGIKLEGNIGSGIGTAALKSPSTGFSVFAFGATNSTIIIAGLATGGVITGVTSNIIETIINGETYYLISSSDGTGWYLVHTAVSQTSYTGDTHSNTTIDGIASTAGMYVGQAISGTNIPAGTRIASVVSANAITITQAATGTTGGVTLTKTPIAKIISANFPAMVGAFAAMDGYIFAVTSSGKIYNSDINTVATWGASSYLEANIKTDIAVTIIRYKQHIVCFGDSSIEFFYNAGNAFGSPLTSRKELFANVGAYSSGTGKKVCDVIDYVFWIGSDFCLYTFDGLSPKNLSQQAMSLGAVISSTTYAPSIITAFQLADDVIVSVVTANTGADKLFSLKNNQFFNPSFGLAQMIWANSHPTTSSFIAVGVSSSDTAGDVFSLDSATFTDDSAAFSMIAQTQPIYLNDGKGFTINSVELIGDTQASGSTTLETSADDYAAFKTVGSFDLTSQKKIVRRGGYYRSNVAFKLTDSGNNAWRGQALKVDWTPAAA